MPKHLNSHTPSYAINVGESPQNQPVTENSRPFQASLGGGSGRTRIVNPEMLQQNVASHVNMVQLLAKTAEKVVKPHAEREKIELFISGIQAAASGAAAKEIEAEQPFISRLWGVNNITAAASMYEANDKITSFHSNIENEMQDKYRYMTPEEFKRQYSEDFINLTQSTTVEGARIMAEMAPKYAPMTFASHLKNYTQWQIDNIFEYDQNSFSNTVNLFGTGIDDPLTAEASKKNLQDFFERRKNETLTDYTKRVAGYALTLGSSEDRNVFKQLKGITLPVGTDPAIVQEINTRYTELTEKEVLKHCLDNPELREKLQNFTAGVNNHLFSENDIIKTNNAISEEIGQLIGDSEYRFFDDTALEKVLNRRSTAVVAQAITEEEKRKNQEEQFRKAQVKEGVKEYSKAAEKARQNARVVKGLQTGSYHNMDEKDKPVAREHVNNLIKSGDVNVRLMGYTTARKNNMAPAPIKNTINAAYAIMGTANASPEDEAQLALFFNQMEEWEASGTNMTSRYAVDMFTGKEKLLEFYLTRKAGYFTPGEPFTASLRRFNALPSSRANSEEVINNVVSDIEIDAPDPVKNLTVRQLAHAMPRIPEEVLAQIAQHKIQSEGIVVPPVGWFGPSSYFHNIAKVPAGTLDKAIRDKDRLLNPEQYPHRKKEWALSDYLANIASYHSEEAEYTILIREDTNEPYITVIDQGQPTHYTMDEVAQKPRKPIKPRFDRYRALRRARSPSN